MKYTFRVFNDETLKLLRSVVLFDNIIQGKFLESISNILHNAVVILIFDYDISYT